jgi:hypothetical protein
MTTALLFITVALSIMNSHETWVSAAMMTSVLLDWYVNLIRVALCWSEQTHFTFIRRLWML